MASLLGGGSAEPLVLEGAGLAELDPGVAVSVELGLGVAGAVLVADGVEPAVVADAFAPELAAELLEATAVWPDHQSFLARCEGEAFR